MKVVQLRFMQTQYATMSGSIKATVSDYSVFVQSLW